MFNARLLFGFKASGFLLALRFNFGGARRRRDDGAVCCRSGGLILGLQGAYGECGHKKYRQPVKVHP